MLVHVGSYRGTSFALDVFMLIRACGRVGLKRACGNVGVGGRAMVLEVSPARDRGSCRWRAACVWGARLLIFFGQFG